MSFPYTWLCCGSLEVQDVLVKTRCRLLDSFYPSGKGWVAVSLRATHYLANHSQLSCVAQNGLAIRTVPYRPNPRGYFDDRVDDDLGQPQIVPGSDWFEIWNGLSVEGQLIGLNDRRKFYRLGDPRKGFENRGARRVLVQTWMAVVQIERIDVEPAVNLPSLATLPESVTDEGMVYEIPAQ